MKSGSCYAAAITAIAAAIAEGRNTEETAFLAAMFVQLGETLETITAAKELEYRKSCRANENM